MPTHGLLLINLGTPDAPRTPEVRRYLREFLSDPRVLDVPAWQRALVLNLFILPFRPKKSAEAYRLIWSDETGSPLLHWGLELCRRVQERLGDEVLVELGMRYQNPPIGAALDRFRAAGVDDIVVLPLFPQYSSAAFGSAVEKLFEEAGRRWNVPNLQVLPPFYDHPGFLDSFAATARGTLDRVAQPDPVPHELSRPSRETGPEERRVQRPATACVMRPAATTLVEANRNCYRAQCFATARGIADRLGLTDDDYTVTFQSRLGRDPWIRPFTDEVIPELAEKGHRNMIILSPAFVADCLETLEELAIRGREDFRGAGGEELTLVPSLNASAIWVDTVVDLVRRGTPIGELDSPS